MALETLNGVKVIGGFDVAELSKTLPIKPPEFIIVNHEENSISFTIQNGSMGYNGVNGCQVDTMLEAVLLIIKGLNTNFPCRENSLAITKIEEALMWLDRRTKDRKDRGVEGTNQK